MVYKWRSGYRANVSAKAAGEVMEQLESEDALTPENLVNVSRPEDAPLHKAFDWNDETAAEKWRMEQAKSLIRHIEVVPMTVGNPEPVRAFFPIRADKPETTYENIRFIVSDEDKRNEMLARAKSELKSFRVKYGQLKELKPVLDAIDRIADGNEYADEENPD